MSRRAYFGTDGIRGAVGSALINKEFMLRLGWAVGSVLVKDQAATVLLGHDTRPSSDRLVSALQKGLVSAGVNVNLLGILPTSAIAYLTCSLSAAAGISMTASHNAYQDNGVKFFNHQGMKLSDETELAIESALDQSMPTINAGQLGKVTSLADAAQQYVEFCKSILPADLNLKGIKLVLDCAYGATYQVAPSIFSELGANVIGLHCSAEGKRINRCCGATNVDRLRAAVKQHQADLGLAFDGDGDRLVMVDHKGETVDGDEILYILAKDRFIGISRCAGVVGTVMSNLGLEHALNAHGIAFERASVGDRYVLAALIRKGWVLGGEASGHIINLDYSTTGDGILTGLQILQIMCLAGKSLHEIKQGMQKWPQVLINLPIDQNIDLESNTTIAEAVRQVESDLKGMGRVLLRPSGTEPLIRIMVEGTDKKVVQRAADSIASVVKNSIGSAHGS